MENQIIQLVLNAWTVQNNAVTDFFNKHNDALYLNRVAPNRNSAIYLLGHLIASNDGLLPLFGISERLYPNMHNLFLKNGYDETAVYPTLAELKANWNTITETLTENFSKMTPEDWLGKHTAVSEEDFAIAQHRNKLNVLIGRTNHQSYHLGQLGLLNPQE